MTTSLSALASTSSAHSSSTVLMSTNTTALNTQNSVSAVVLNVNNSNQASNGLSSNLEGVDSNCETKTEFYTREGLWRLVKNGEYMRQNQNQYIQQQINQTVNGQIGVNANNSNQISSNEPVKIMVFKYAQTDETQSKSIRKFMCKKCFKNKIYQINSSKSRSNTAGNKIYFGLKHDEYDDDADVVTSSNRSSRINENDSEEDACFNENNSKSDDEDDDEIIEDVYLNENLPYSDDTDQETNDIYCKYCNRKLNTRTNANKIESLLNSTHPFLDLVVFNYAREIYFYEFNFLKTKSANNLKNLVDKKAYRTFISTCFDINLIASMSNTIDLQANISQNTITNNNNNINSDNNNNANNGSNNSSNLPSTSSTNSIANNNLNPSQLSIIVAAGFNKGEIHVFDGFKKDASVFYNNNRLVDKSKVTCIKWVPKSMNLFLAGYSSGNIYLYDANVQTQSNVAPLFTKLYQDQSFSIHINNQSSSSFSTNSNNTNAYLNTTRTSPVVKIQVSSKQNTLLNTPTKLSTNPILNVPLVGAVNSQSNTNENQLKNNSYQIQQKLVLLSSNQQTTQIAKNPLLKWSIGAPNTNENFLDSTNFTNVNGVSGINGVNEFAFSPCGSFLAVVSQDGYLRVFSFSYHNNQQMQVQLRCSMKSYFGGLLCVCWSPDGRYIATGGEDDLITVFSFVEMRVACRGRGHSSWINSLVFDPWTSNNIEKDYNKHSKLSANNSNKQTNNEYLSDKDDESDLDDLQLQDKLNLNSSKSDMQTLKERKKIISAKKNRTISTLSDFNYTNLNAFPSTSIYYRLASCGQDNQICFWDLTEDVLKEKTTQLSKSRLASAALNNSYQQKQSSQGLPQIIIQSSDSANSSTANNKNQHQNQSGSGNSSTNNNLNNNNNNNNHYHHHHHHSTSSIVSTARNLFSLKHDSKAQSQKSKNSNNNNNNNTSDSLNEEAVQKASSSLATSFFKKHKRNSSLNSNSNSLVSDSSSQNSKTKSNSKSSQVTLHSYKKSGNTINTIASTINGENIELNSSLTDSGINSLSKKSSFNDSNKSGSNKNSNNNNVFNVCPKLDEIPIIEPLICKRIATERLTSILFKEDCFLVATQDGYVFTWARPTKNDHNLNSASANKFSGELKTNITSL